jgi:hypothetical protein
MIIFEKSENHKNYALVQKSKVVNILVWDGELEFYPEGELIELLEGQVAGIDWDYIDGEFVDNRPNPSPAEN